MQMNESDQSLHFEVTLARSPLNANAAASRIHLEAIKYLQGKLKVVGELQEERWHENVTAAMRFLGDQRQQVPQEPFHARKQHLLHF